MDYNQLAKEFGGSLASPPPKDEKQPDFAALAKEFGGTLAPTAKTEGVDYSALAAEFGGTPLSRGTGDLAVSGTKAGVTGLKSTFEGLSFLRNVDALDRVNQAFAVYDAIDKGEVTSPAEASKMGLNVTSAAKYLRATPEARLKMRENQFGSQEERRALVSDSIKAFQAYQKEMADLGKGVPNFTDIESINGFRQWLTYNLPSAAVQLAPIMVAAVTTGGAGAFTLGAGMGVGETVGNRMEFVLDKVKNLPPEKQANEIEKYIRDTKDVTMAVGLASGALDLAGPVGAILRQRAGKEGVKYLTKREAAKAGVKEAPRIIGEEAATGAGQEAVQILGEKKLGEMEDDLISTKNFKRIIDAGAVEALGGGVGAGVTTGTRVGQTALQQRAERVAADEAALAERQTRVNQRLEQVGTRFNELVTKFTSQGMSEQEAVMSAGAALAQEGIDLDQSIGVGAGRVEPTLTLPSGETAVGEPAAAPAVPEVGGLEPSGVDVGGVGARAEAVSPALTEAPVQPVADGDTFFDKKAFEEVDQGRKSRSTIVYMSPDEYLRMAEPGLSEERVEEVRQVAEEGTKFSTIPKLVTQEDPKTGTAKVVQSDGRHRATVLRDMGVTSMPVELRGMIRWSEQDDPEKFDYWKGQWPTILEAEKSTDTMEYPVKRPTTTPEPAAPTPSETTQIPAEAQAPVDTPAVDEVTEDAKATEAAKVEAPVITQAPITTETGLAPVGKKRGRPRVEKTPEQVAADQARRRAAQGAGRDAIRLAENAQKVVQTPFDEGAFANEVELAAGQEARNAEVIDALTDAYRILGDNRFKKNKAGQVAKTVIDNPNVTARQKEIALNRAKRGPETVAKAEPLTESTNSEPNPEFGKFTTATEALRYIARTGNPFERLMADRLLPFVKDVRLVLVRDPQTDITNKRLRKKFSGALGMYAESKTQRAIYLNTAADTSGLNNTTILHEALHGATMAKINAWVKDKSSVDPKTRAAIEEMQSIMLRAGGFYGILSMRNLTDARTDALYRLEAFTDIKEFVAYGLTQPEMQEFLMQLPGRYKAGERLQGSIFTRFVNSIRKMFNIGPEQDNAFLDLVVVTDKLLRSPDVLPESVTAAPAKKLTATQKLEDKLATSKRYSDLNASIPELLKQVRSYEDGKRLLESIFQAGTIGTLRTALGFYSSKGIVRQFGNRVANLKNVSEAVENLNGMRAQLIREFAEKVPAWVKFGRKHEAAGRLLGDTMHVSTLLSVDPTLHTDLTSALANDAQLQQLRADAQDPNLTPKQKSSAQGRVTRREREIKTVYVRWDRLGQMANGEGQRIYRIIKQAYQDTFDLHEQLLTEKIAASTVPGDINDASTPKGKLMASITKTFQEARKLQVYFPLMRYGKYWFSVGKGANSQFFMFETATARNNAVRKRAQELGKSLESLLADQTIRQGDDIGVLRNEVAESSKMLKEIFEMLDQNKLTDVEAVKDQVYQMYLMTLPERDIRRRFTHRQGKTGFSADVIRNFITSQHTAANQLSRLKYSDQIRNAIGASYAELAGNPEALKLSAVVDEIAAKALAEVMPSAPDDFINKFATLGNQIAFYWLLSSIKSAVIQMTQLPIVGTPVLAAEYGAARVAATMGRYSFLFNKLGTTKRDAQGNVITEWGQPSINDSQYVNKHPDPTYRNYLKRAWNHANDKDMFMSTYAADMTARAKVPTGAYEGVIRSGTRAVINMMGGAFHHLERISREIMYMSTFELEFAKAKSEGLSGDDAYARAVNKATELTYESLFDYTTYNKPRYFQKGFGKLSFQFATYPLNVMSFLLRNFYGMLPYLNRDGKREAAIKFFGVVGMTGLFAGATGLPFYSLIMGFAEGIREMMRPDVDEEDDEEDIDAAMGYDMDAEGNPLGKRSLDLWFRGWFLPHFFGEGSSIAKTFNLNKDQAHLLRRSVEVGPIAALTDVDISGSTSMAEIGEALWILSAAKNGIQFFLNPVGSGRDKVAEAAFEEMAGPFGGVVTDFLGGMDDLRKGDVLRGMEKLSPAFFKGSFRAARLEKEGFVSKSGEEIMDPEYYTTGKLLAQTLGFGSTEVNAVQKANFQAKQIDMKLRGQRKDLLDKLAVAVRQDSDEKIDDAVKDIFQFNVKNVQYQIDGEDISRSLSARQRRAGRSYQGVSGSASTEAAIFPLIENTRTPKYQ
jgi:hypothetical protein